MATHTEQVRQLKQAAAAHAVAQVESGMVLGLGSGSTATLALHEIGARLGSGALHDIVGVPTSDLIAQEASAAGVPTTTLEEHARLDLTIDGADEVDPDLNLIKGGGGALLREKIVAQASRRVLIIVDESKLSPCLGTAWAVPIEVVTFGCGAQIEFLQSLGGQAILRSVQTGAPFVTDHGNYILDCNFGPIQELSELTRKLEERAGIVEHGLFVGLASEVIVASAAGIRVLS